MSVIDEVKQRTDIVEVASQYTTLTKAGRNFKGLCPFHSEKHPSFFIYPEQQSWHCFGACGTGGDVFSFVMKKEGTSFGEALRLLAERAGVTIPSFKEDAGKDEKERLYQVNEAAAQYFHNLLLNSSAGEEARSYVASRGLSPETITSFQLGYSLDSPDALKQYLMKRGYSEGELLAGGLVILTEEGKTYDRFRNFLMFPICDARGRVTGFGARVLDDSAVKYINSPKGAKIPVWEETPVEKTPIFDKSSSLYGINLAREAIRQQDLTVIVEGYMDVITAHQNGFNNVVASMGTAINDKNINALKRLTKNMALALDADAAGEDAWLRFVRDANAFDINIKLLILPHEKDPDDVIKEDPEVWQRLVAEAPLVTDDIDYVINAVTSSIDLGSAKGKSLATQKLLPIIAEMKDTIVQDHYIQKLAKTIGVTTRKLESSLAAYMARRGIKSPMRQADIKPAPSPLVSNPLEEYCLALLLQHPELKTHQSEILPEYFENSENREIFNTFRQTKDVNKVKDEIDNAIWEHLDYLMTKNLPSNQIEEKLSSCILRLRERFLRSLELKKGAILASEAETGGTPAELTKLEEQGIDVSVQLREVFIQRSRRGQKQRREG